MYDHVVGLGTSTVKVPRSEHKNVAFAKITGLNVNLKLKRIFCERKFNDAEGSLEFITKDPAIYQLFIRRKPARFYDINKKSVRLLSASEVYAMFGHMNKRIWKKKKIRSEKLMQKFNTSYFRKLYKEIGVSYKSSHIHINLEDQIDKVISEIEHKKEDMFIRILQLERDVDNEKDVKKIQKNIRRGDKYLTELELAKDSIKHIINKKIAGNGSKIKQGKGK